jgi:hypothetical protein
MANVSRRCVSSNNTTPLKSCRERHSVHAGRLPPPLTIPQSQLATDFTIIYPDSVTIRNFRLPGDSAAHRLGRRANALVLLDDGMGYAAVAKVLLLDDDTVRTWRRLYEDDGIEGLAGFGYEGSACRLSNEQ